VKWTTCFNVAPDNPPPSLPDVLARLVLEFLPRPDELMRDELKEQKEREIAFKAAEQQKQQRNVHKIICYDKENANYVRIKKNAF